jgi:ABC-type Mn2+/Zn2+ transport system permease subunit
VLSVIIGLTTSFYAGLKPGGTITITAITILMLVIVGKEGAVLLHKKHKHHNKE